MSKKRKHDQVEPDAVPAPDDGPGPDSSTPAKTQKAKGQSRQEKSERRAKKKKSDTRDRRQGRSELEPPAIPMIEEDAPSAHESEKPSITQENAKSRPTKKEKTKKSSSKKQSKDDTDANTESEPKPDKSASRFIVFVGNLPFTATVAQVQDHFVKLAPTSVRLSTDKATGRGKGFAFVEFDGYDKMKTCLKLYHHSIFDPDAKGKDKTHQEQDDAMDGKKRGRRINVELTAGGGGKNSKERKERIKSKNIKLDEERERTRVKERTEQEEAARKKQGRPRTGANAAQKDNGSIHPSRLAQMNH
ncbi:uncharacterized protein A1O9_05867 [Exophiala aquamarina CBS 119918]|uniref:RRM domain-containing protein n=1 Tax=Exophiala aquamarina CBS 119918 TaxID=1182545 RepID=A0A072PQZ5_9EURO|nr:uncharacterized protein A1O9_05867 [Exophiala aquamarina CBS 119918]KEF57945.1 hypothetical protein A1O9_05867 [Exophiala aquamarina CBS 119918]